MDDFEEQMREQLRRQSMDAAMDRRVKRLKLSFDQHTDRHRKISRLMNRSEKKRTRLTEKMLQSRPDDRAFSLIMNEYAQNMLHATGPYHLYPFFPGLGDLAPFMKPINSDGASIFTPWPVQQHLYLQSDFDAVKDRLTSGEFGDPRPTPMSEFALDYAPIPETQMAIAQGMALWEYRLPVKPEELTDPEITNAERNGWIEHGVPMTFGHLGTRVVSDRRGAHCLSVYTPGSGLAGRMLARPMEEMGAEFDSDAQHYPLSIAIVTSTDHTTGETKCAWFGHQFDHMTETGFGYSSRASDNRMYTPEQRNEAEGLHILLHDFYQRNIEMLMLPTYFALQVEEIEHLEPSQARELVRSGGTTPTKTGEAPARKPSRFQIVKAVRKSRLIDAFEEKDRETEARQGEGRTRAEPETQVDVPGFWRRVRKSAFGKGPNGEPVPGKTWVTPHVRYKDKPASDKTKVKEPLAPHITFR
jgi:hypothetical protein